MGMHVCCIVPTHHLCFMSTHVCCIVLTHRLKVASCPSGTQGASLDIVWAYRSSPLPPRHKAYVASKWRNKIYVDHCAMEGLSSSGNIQGIPVDALVALLNHHGVDKVLKWVDDFCLFHIPFTTASVEKDEMIPCYSTDIHLILTFTCPLGVPWHPVTTKGQDFASTVPYVRFIWDLDNCTVSLSSKKCLKYLDKVQAFQSLTKSKVSHKQSMSVHGTLHRIMFIYRQGCSSLPPLSVFISKFPNEFTLHHIPKLVLVCLEWWIAIL